MKIEVYIYTGGDLLRPQAHVFTARGDRETVLREHREKGGPEVQAAKLGEREFGGGEEHQIADWSMGVMNEWLSHQALPSFQDLDTGIVYEMEERDLPETVRRYRRIWP